MPTTGLSLEFGESYARTPWRRRRTLAARGSRLPDGLVRSAYAARSGARTCLGMIAPFVADVPSSRLPTSAMQVRGICRTGWSGGTLDYCNR